MAQVSRSVALAAAPDAVWALIGGFQALPDWHPAVQASGKEEQGGVELRRLDLGGGAEILEKWLGGDAMSYGYEILEPGPLPVMDYRSTITVAPAGAGSVVVWSSTFTPSGDEEASKGAIAGVYEGGLAILAEKFG